MIVSATAGFLFLWLERIYNNGVTSDILAPLADIEVFVTGSSVISVLTSPLAAIIVGVFGAVIASAEHHAKLWMLLVGLILTGTAASLFLKGMIQLPRPDDALLQLGTYGFPSTHATVATIIFIAGTWLTYHWKNLQHRRVIITLIGFSWILISLSRIILSVHNTSDVLAGILLGTCVAATGLAAAPYIFKRLDISSQTLKE